jgi:PHP family Zn ribbon phosphoesterase
LNTPFCPNCGGKKLVKGVADRIEEIADVAADSHPPTRPAYHYQVPLHMLPGLGSKTLDKLVDVLGTEMELIHAVPLAELERVGGRRAAAAIAAVRSGTATVQSGGGGIYGKVGLP